MKRTRMSHLALSLLAALVATTCSDNSPTTGSESHWLACQTDRDCHGNDVCYGGYCTDPDTIAGIEREDAERSTRTHAIALSAAGDTTCAAMSDGSVMCWGSNDYGNLGTGDTEGSAEPVRVSGLDSAISVAVGGRHACALLENGTVRCWGDVGNEPTAVDGLNDVVELAAGSAHTCALLSDHTVKCWGEGEAGQLGDGRERSSAVPVKVVGVSTAIDVAPTCAVLTDGTVRCWGRDAVEATLMPEFSDAVSIVSDQPLCVIREAGTVQCRREDLAESEREVVPLDSLNGVASAVVDARCAVTGDGDLWCIESGSLQKKTNVVEAREVVEGDSHACVLQKNGQVKCWGSALYGQLGNGVRFRQAVPLKVDALPSASEVAATRGFSCALGADGMYCWGDRFGTPGDTVADRTVAAIPVADAIAISAGYGVHRCITEDCGGGYESACVLRKNGQVSCLDETELAPVAGVSNATAISAADGGCALTADGQVFCWGEEATPTSALAGSELVAKGDEHRCAVDHEGVVRCVGSSGAVRWESSTVIEPLPPVVSLSAGIDRTCAVVEDGRVFCWGEPHLGDGTNEASSVPRQVHGIDSAVAVATANHSCALLRTGEVHCWGAGRQGQLGNGATTDQWLPRPVKDLDGARGVAVGKEHTCAVVGSGDVYCWGGDEFGRVSGGRAYEYVDPVDVAWPTESEGTPEQHEDPER